MAGPYPGVVPAVPLGGRSLQVARGFCAGGLAAFACMIVVPLAIQAVQAWARFPGAMSAALQRAPIPLSFVVGGLLAGRALDIGRRGSLAVALAMLVTGVIQSLALGDVGSLTGREDPFVVVAFVASASVGAYAAGGACGAALLGLNIRKVCWLAAGFGVAGLLGSLAVVVAFFLVRSGAGAVLGAVFPLALLVCQAASVLGPFVVSGAAISRALEDGRR